MRFPEELVSPLLRHPMGSRVRARIGMVASTCVWAVRYHPDDALTLCYLSREATIDSLPCRPGASVTERTGSTQIALHPNGRLRRCRLARAVTSRGAVLRGGDRVALDSTGATEARR
jgi:hypothetical protein